MCRRRIVIKEDLVAEDKCSIGELTWAQLSTMVQKRPQSARGQAGVQMERRSSSSSWGFSSRRARVFFILQSPPRVFKKRGVGYERSISQSVVSGSPAHPASENATFSRGDERNQSESGLGGGCGGGLIRGSLLRKEPKKSGCGSGAGLSLSVPSSLGLRVSGRCGGERLTYQLSGVRSHLSWGFRHRRRKKTGGRRRIVIKEDLVAEELIFLIVVVVVVVLVLFRGFPF